MNLRSTKAKGRSNGFHFYSGTIYSRPTYGAVVRNAFSKVGCSKAA